MSSTTTIDDWRELARRESDGLVVSLLWSRADDRVTLSVADERLDEEFQLGIPRTCALDAFYHPFAYASGRGLGFAGSLREPSSAVVPERSASR